jgi:CBS domain-containing protein
MDAAAFLRAHAPFDGLDESTLRSAAEAAHELRAVTGSVIIRQGGDPSPSLFVIVEGSVDVVADGRALDVMGEGDVFGHMSLVTQEEPVATIRAREDTVCLTLDRETASQVLGTRAGAAFITESLRRRFDELTAAAREQPIRTVDSTVGSLIRGPALECDSSDSVGRVARAMAEARSSAAVVHTAGGIGIVTDVDLRIKVLAEGRDASTPVWEIASSPASTVDKDVLAAEALFQMVEGGFHHLPVVSVTGEVVGIVSETDVIGFGNDSPFAIRSAIERADDRAACIEAARRLPDSVVALVDAGVDAVHIGYIVGATMDVLTRRLLVLAFDEQGPPPVAWAWLAFGSLGRREQALHTDQDHGLAYQGTTADEERLDPYFAAVAEFVTQGLQDAGIPRCEGNMMATSAGLRRSVEGWENQLAAWTGKHERHASEIVAVVFDFRQVAGTLEIAPILDRIVRGAAADAGLMRLLVAQALEHEPPAGHLRGFVVKGSGEHAGSLDLKHGGIVPITDIARFHAVAAGISAHRTLDRLRIASDVGQIDEATRAGLHDAFTLLWQLRLERQVHCVRERTPPDDFVDPNALTPVRRQGLREAFRVIARAQRTVSLRA